MVVGLVRHLVNNIIVMFLFILSGESMCFGISNHADLIISRVGLCVH